MARARGILLDRIGRQDRVVVATDVLGEQQANVLGVAPELAVRKGPLLKRSERLDPLVRLSEQAQPEHAHDDDQQNGADEGHEQLGVDAGRQSADGPDQWIVGRAQQTASCAPAPVSCGGRCASDNAQIFSSAVPPTKFVISQRLSILATSRFGRP